MNTNIKYTKEILEPIVKDSFSFTEVTSKLRKVVNGRYISYFKELVIKFEIDFSHFKNRPKSKITNKRERTHVLRKLLQSSGVEERCSSCQLKDMWNNQPITLQIDHINNNPLDNRVENLRYLCPNCHSQTTGFNRRKPQRVKSYILKNPNKKYDKSHTRKVIRPSKEELEKLVWEKPCTQIAKDFNLSDSAIMKWCKNYEINKPPRGYWTKFNKTKNNLKHQKERIDYENLECSIH